MLGLTGLQSLTTGSHVTPKVLLQGPMLHQKSYYRVPCYTKSLTTGSHVTLFSLKSYYRVPCHTKSLTTGSHVTPKVLLQGPMSHQKSYYRVPCHTKSLTTGSHVTLFSLKSYY